MTTRHPSERVLAGLDIQHRDRVPSTLVGFLLPSNVSSLEKAKEHPWALSCSLLSLWHQMGWFAPALPPPPRHSHSINPALVPAQSGPEVTSCGFTGHLRAF